MSSKSEPCEYFEVCNLEGSIKRDTGTYCILHASEPKSVQKFTEAIREHLEAGRSDFRYVRFLKDHPADLHEVEFPGLADFQDAWIPEMLNLRKASLPMGLTLTGKVKSIALDEAVVNGPVDIRVGDLPDGFHLTKAHFEEGLTLTIDRCGGIALQHAIIDGPIEIRVAELPGDITGFAAKLRGGLSLQANRVHGVNFKQSELHGQLVLDATFLKACAFDSATILGGLDFDECQFNQILSFDGAMFAPTSDLNFSNAFISHDLKIIGRFTPPRAIRLNGTRIKGLTHIEGEPGKPRIRIIAPDQHPRFGGDVVFINVDLGECRLVGNAIVRIQQMELTNVRWQRKCGRSILYDETMMRDRETANISNLKETYQVLKEKYRQVGDHVTSGDFHFGEMEMKRREKGWPRRVLCLEFLYWALSGYGTRWFQALLVLATLVIGFAYAYMWTDPGHFSNDFLEALRFSVQVTAFQRPLTPEGLSEGGRCFQVVQTILGPLQIGLFALALRMRLKR